MDKHRLYALILSVTGIAICGFAWSLMSIKQGDIIPNPLTLKGSPYGKTIALAMQSNIDNYWHSGSTHSHENSEDHDHDHSDHSDSHAHIKDESPTPLQKQPQEFKKIHPNHVFIKRRIHDLRNKNALNNSKFPKSLDHHKFIEARNLQQVILAYEMDPKSYTNYGSYHFFITTYGYRDQERKIALAKQLADQTIELCGKDKESLGTMLTAMLGYEHKLLLMLEEPKQHTFQEYQIILDNSNKVAYNYQNRLNQLIESNEIANLSPERIKETTGRFKAILARMQAHRNIILLKQKNNSLAT